MSRGASESQEQNKRFTSVRLIGGVDCNINRTSRYPDLDVKGGARIRKTLCSDGDLLIGGDATVNGNLTVLGNASFDTLIVSNLLADFIDSTIAIIDDLTSVTITANVVTANSFIGDLFGNICSDTTIKGDAVIQGNLTVDGNITTIDTENILVEDNKLLLNNGESGAGVTEGTAGLEIDRGSLVNYLLCFEESRGCTVVGTQGNTKCVAIREDNPIGNAIAFWDDSLECFVTSAGLIYDNSGNILNANVCGDIVTNGIMAKSGGLINVFDDVDIQCQNVSNVEVLEVNSIVSKSGNGLDIMCGNLANVDVIEINSIVSKSGGNLIMTSDVCMNGNLYVSNVFGKSPINVFDNINAFGNIVVDGEVKVGNTVINDVGVYSNGNVFIDGTQVVGPQQPTISLLALDGGLTGITPDGSLVTVGNTTISNEGPTINDNFADLTEKVNMMLNVLAAHGLIA